MAQRILFAGEEQPLWREFQNHGWTPESGWSGEFARTEPEALALLQQGGFAAVVVGGELAAARGVELLEQALQRQPKAFRLALTDSAEPGTALQYIGRGHNAVAGPCSLARLLGVLDWGGPLQTWLPNAAVRELVQRLPRVPSPPTIYAQVLAEAQSAEASVERIGDLIAQDPALSAKMLQLANSVAFGLQLPVSHPAEAVTYVGLETTKSLVLLAYAFSRLEPATLAGFSVDALWQHSVQTSRYGRQLALREGTGPEVANQAFTAGLLHDLGKLLLVGNVPEQYGQALKLARAQQCSLREAEHQVFGVSHAEVGGCLLALWGLPKPLVEAVALHHEPARLAADGFSVLTAVHVANALVHEEHRDSAAGPSAELDLAYLKQLGLEQRVEEWRRCCRAQP